MDKNKEGVLSPRTRRVKDKSAKDTKDKMVTQLTLDIEKLGKPEQPPVSSRSLTFSRTPGSAPLTSVSASALKSWTPKFSRNKPLEEWEEEEGDGGEGKGGHVEGAAREIESFADLDKRSVFAKRGR